MSRGSAALHRTAAREGSVGGLDKGFIALVPGELASDWALAWRHGGDARQSPSRHGHPRSPSSVERTRR